MKMEPETRDRLIRTGIYGANVAAHPIGKVFSDSLSLGNPYIGLAYGALDIVGGLSNRVRSSVFMRLSKFAGAVYFGASSVLNLNSIINGDFSDSDNFLFNGSMSYQLSRDVFQYYVREGNDLLDDICSVVGFSRRSRNRFRRRRIEGITAD